LVFRIFVTIYTLDSLLSTLSLSSFSSLLSKYVSAALMATIAPTTANDSRVGVIIVFSTSPAMINSNPVILLVYGSETAA
jgi:hypothetical protein